MNKQAAEWQRAQSRPSTNKRHLDGCAEAAQRHVVLELELPDQLLAAVDVIAVKVKAAVDCRDEIGGGQCLGISQLHPWVLAKRPLVLWL